MDEREGEEEGGGGGGGGGGGEIEVLVCTQSEVISQHGPSLPPHPLAQV